MGSLCLRGLCRVGLAGCPYRIAKKRGFYGLRIGAISSRVLISATLREHTFLNLSDYMVKVQTCKVVFPQNKYGGLGSSESRRENMVSQRVLVDRVKTKPRQRNQKENT